MDLSRQSFLGAESDKILSSLRIAIVGLGGGGSHIAQQLAHVGIGNFVLIDFDRIDASNLNRLVGATAKDVKRATLKVEIIRKRIKAINPAAVVKSIAKPWQETEAAIWLSDCDAIFGCVDRFTDRRDLEVTARRYLIPYIDIGMDVHSLSAKEFGIGGQVVVSMPGELCLRCMGFLTDELINKEAQAYGAAGGRPQVIWPNGVLASLAVGMFMQLFTPWHAGHRSFQYAEYDGNVPEVKVSSRMPYIEQKKCMHFAGVNSLGDPFFALPVKGGC